MQQKRNGSNLEKQIMELQEQKRYDVLMTEHERRVNHKDMRAYEHAEASIHGKIHGFGGRGEAQRQQNIVYGKMGGMREGMIDGSGVSAPSPQKSTLDYANVLHSKKNQYQNSLLNKMIDKNQRSQIQIGGLN